MEEKEEEEDNEEEEEDHLNLIEGKMDGEKRGGIVISPTRGGTPAHTESW